MRVTGPGIDLYWLPLGAGGHVVRLNGRVSRQSPRGSSAGSRALHHSGLEVRAPDGRFVIEMTPIAGATAPRGASSPRARSAWGRRAGRLLRLVPVVPTPVWGRDELCAGELWNSNSLVSWLLARAGLAPETIPPPRGGRAPGWRAGIVVARRAA